MNDIKKILELHLKWIRCEEGGVKADLGGADLRGADLGSADLRGANLYGADLRRAMVDENTFFPSPTMLLLAYWGEVSPELCIELMRYDAFNHPDPSTFDEWAKTGKCPFLDLKWQRAAQFQERQKLWSPGPAKSAIVLAQMLIAEKMVKK